MSTKPDRRKARREKHARTHNWSADALLLERAAEFLDSLIPRPSNQVPTSGHGRSK